MIKKISKYLILLTMMCLLYNFSLLFNETNKIGKNNDVKAEVNNCELYPLINQFYYKITDQIDLTFIVKSEAKIKEIDYDLCGFTILEEPYYKDNVYFKVRYDDRYVNLSILLRVIFENGRTLSSKVYAIVQNDYIYISRYSFDDARDMYYSEALKSGLINEKEYEIIMIDKNKSNIKNNSMASEKKETLPRSANGGWVVGLIRWIDDWGYYHPLQYTKVYVYDKNSFFSDELLGSVYTDGNGEFFFSFDSNVDSDFDNTGRDIFIKVKPEGINSIVKNGVGNDYIIERGPFNDVVTGAVTDASLDIYNMSSYTNRAFQVSQAVITASRFASVMNGSNLSNVSVCYPHYEGGDGSFYRSSNNTIYIIGNRSNDEYEVDDIYLRSYASWDVIMHEYGHFVQDMLNINDGPGGTHWLNHNMYDHYLSHYSGSPTPNCDSCSLPSAINAKSYAIKLTYAEAWASIFSGISQKYYVDLGILDSNIKTVGDSEYEAYNNAHIDYENKTLTGEAAEEAIIGVLWDVFDSNSDDYDSISLGYTGLWSLSTTYNPVTFSDFTGNFYSSIYSYNNLEEFNALLEHFGMAPTDIDISSSAVSHVAPTLTWTANGTSDSLPNNYFDITIYDSDDNIIVSDYSYSTYLTLSLSDWASVINASGDKFYVSVEGSQTTSPTTGSYCSTKYAFDKPEVETTISSGSVKVTGYYSWTPSELTISSSYGGYSTSSIDDAAFYGCSGLTEITIPNSVTSIGSGAFKNCTNLSYVSLPSYITTIEDETFKGCTSLEDIGIPSSVTSIGDEAFKGCTSLEDVYITSGVTSIGDSAFEGCTSLEEINISSNVTSIGDDAFKNCSSLDDVSINREQRSLTSLGTNAFYGCSSYLEITVPQNRIADYINASNWSSYDIIPDSSSYTYYSLNNSTNLTIPLSLSSGYNQIYELRVTSQNIYNISYTSSDIVLLKLYDDDFSLIASGVISEELDVGYYYLSVEFISTYSSGNINVSIVKYTPHVHSYTTYLWDSYTQHRKVCSCGSTLFEGHAINAGSLGPGQQYAQCILCNGLASVGFIGPDSINQYPSTVNGSYILPNGVVVLVAADINDYLNGTLIFNYPNVNSINNNLPYLKKEEYWTK